MENKMNGYNALEIKKLSKEYPHFRLDRLTYFRGFLQVFVEFGVKRLDVLETRLHDLVATGAFLVQLTDAKEVLERHCETSAQKID